MFWTQDIQSWLVQRLPRQIGGIIEILGSAHRRGGFAVPVRIYAAFNCRVCVSFIDRIGSFNAWRQARIEDALADAGIFSGHNVVNQ